MVVAIKCLDGKPMQLLAQDSVASGLKSSMSKPKKGRSDLQLYQMYYDPMPSGMANSYCCDGEIAKAVYTKTLSVAEKKRWLEKLAKMH